MPVLRLCQPVPGCVPLRRRHRERARRVVASRPPGIQLELLSGPLTGIYDPSGMGAMLFAVLAVALSITGEQEVSCCQTSDLS
jgi:hypothetical protein